MIYIDTNVLVSFINPKDSLHKKAVKLLSKLNETVISELTIIELYSVYSRTMNLSEEEIEALVEYTLRVTGVLMVKVDWNRLLNKAISYANKLKLKTLDLLHVVSSYLIGSTSIVTFDNNIKKKEDIIRKEFKIKVIS